MTFTRTTQMAYQSVMFALLAIAAAVVASVIPDELDILRGAVVGAAGFCFITGFVSTISTLFKTDQEIDSNTK